jgi:hypothetical protein
VKLAGVFNCGFGGMDADVIIFNGIVLTMQDGAARAEAVALLGRDILKVGTDDEVKALAGPKTRVSRPIRRAVMSCRRNQPFRALERPSGIWLMPGTPCGLRAHGWCSLRTGQCRISIPCAQCSQR